MVDSQGRICRWFFCVSDIHCLLLKNQSWNDMKFEVHMRKINNIHMLSWGQSYAIDWSTCVVMHNTMLLGSKRKLIPTSSYIRSSSACRANKYHEYLQTSQQLQEEKRGQ